MLEWLLQVWVSFRSRQGFLGRDRVSGTVSRQGFLMSRHGSQAAGSCLVTTSYFHVAIMLASLL